MHGFAPEHALQSAKAYMVYYGLPMVAKYDKSTKEYVKASRGHLQYRFWQVVGSYVYTGSLYSIFFMFPKYFPRCGTVYSDHYFTLSYIFSNQSLRNTTFYTRKLLLKLVAMVSYSIEGRDDRRDARLLTSCLSLQCFSNRRCLRAATEEILSPLC